MGSRPPGGHAGQAQGARRPADGAAPPPFRPPEPSAALTFSRAQAGNILLSSAEGGGIIKLCDLGVSAGKEAATGGAKGDKSGAPKPDAPKPDAPKPDAKPKKAGPPAAADRAVDVSFSEMRWCPPPSRRTPPTPRRARPARLAS